MSIERSLMTQLHAQYGLFIRYHTNKKPHQKPFKALYYKPNS